MSSELDILKDRLFLLEEALMSSLLPKRGNTDDSLVFVSSFGQEGYMELAAALNRVKERNK